MKYVTLRLYSLSVRSHREAMYSEDVVPPCGKRQNYQRIEVQLGERRHMILSKHLCSSLTHVLETLERSINAAHKTQCLTLSVHPF